MSEQPLSKQRSSLLGCLGLVPFATLAVATALAPPDLQPFAATALRAYGATILSFLGGIYWGLVIAAPERRPSAVPLFLGVGVVPQLVGWVALLLPGSWGCVLTAASLVALLLVDRAAVKSGLAPGWFFHLRWPLSCAAALALLVGALMFGF